MTAPDHRPFLADTDLRTAEDVAAWLREHAPRYYDDGVADALDARLDRERRQACRRGARDAWRRFSCVARSWAMRDCAWSLGWPYPAARVLVAQTMIRDLTRALAFRAAARQP